MSLLLQVSRHGGLDMGSRSIEAQRCLQAGDQVGYMVTAFNMPRNMAIRNVAYTEVRREFPHLDAATQDRIAEQRALINGYVPTPEKRTTPMSAAELNRKVAEVGAAVLRDQQILRSAADDEEDATDLTTCPNCGHIWDDTEEQ